MAMIISRFVNQTINNFKHCNFGEAVIWGSSIGLIWICLSKGNWLAAFAWLLTALMLNRAISRRLAMDQVLTRLIAIKNKLTEMEQKWEEELRRDQATQEEKSAERAQRS